MSGENLKNAGEENLQHLLASMDPVLHEDEFVFCTVKHRVIPADLSPIMRFEEAEGSTLIVTKKQADHAELDYAFVSRMITLNVHSSLEAVGFLAKITEHLAGHGISLNAVSAFYHDHLFVPVDKAGETYELLMALQQSHAAG